MKLKNANTRPCKRGHTAERDKRGRCRECNRIRSRGYDAEAKERRRIYAQKWWEENKARGRENNRRWLAENKEARKVYMRRYKGRPEPTRPEPEVCECCGSPPVGHPCLYADHDHKSGKFRGWLCMRCNAALGLLKDQPELAVIYLAKSEH